MIILSLHSFPTRRSSDLFEGEHRRPVGNRRRRLVVIASTADEEQRFVRGRFVGFDYRQPVLPDRAVNVFFCAPPLRGQLQDETFVSLAWNRIDQLPRISRIRFRDVAVERGLLSPRRYAKQCDGRRRRHSQKRQAKELKVERFHCQSPKTLSITPLKFWELFEKPPSKNFSYNWNNSG